MEQYLGLIIAIVGVGIAMVGIAVMLFLLSRREARSDARHADSKIDEIRILSDSKIEAIRLLVDAIREDIRDFHKKVYDLDKKNSEETARATKILEELRSK